jgi:hypothetical protein
MPMISPESLPPVFGGFFLEPFDVEALLKAVRYWAFSVSLAALVGIGSLIVTSSQTSDQGGADEGLPSHARDGLRDEASGIDVLAQLLDRRARREVRPATRARDVEERGGQGNDPSVRSTERATVHPSI